MPRSDPILCLLDLAPVNDELRRFILRIRDEINAALWGYLRQHGVGEPLRRAVTHLLGKGKLIRSIFSYVLSMGLGIDRERALKLAAAIEYSHMASMIHDDLIDGAEYRRGVRSVHAAYGRGMAIVAGDYLILLSSYLINDLGSEAVRESLVAGMKMCEGEALEEEGEMSLRRYFRVAYLKTASLFEHIARVNARLAGLGEATVRRHGEFGRAVGMAFQIRDDILDVIGDEELMGKPTWQDVNKPNIVWVLKRRRGLTIEGAVERAQAILNYWVDRARGLLRTLGLKRIYADALEAVIAALAVRHV